MAQAQVSVAPPSQLPPTAETHTVRPGETLWGISRLHFGQPLIWPVIQKGNSVGEPRRLQIGTVLRLGERAAVRDAEVLAVTGDVRGPLGELLTTGARLAEGAVIRTGPDSFVTLRLPDGARSTLPSNSSVRLVQFFDVTGRVAVLMDLQAGDVESRVPPRGVTSGAHRVRTRMATVGVRGTHFRVSLPDPSTTSVSVLESAVDVTSPARRPVVVRETFGFLEGGGPRAGVLQELLPAPQWIDAGRAQNQPGVLLSWSGVPGAATYRAQVARDADFVDVVAEQRVARTGEQEMAVFDGIAGGSYFARVGAITPEGIEGLINLSGFSRAGVVLNGKARWLVASSEIEFAWQAVAGATYRLEVADDARFEGVAVAADGLHGNRARIGALPPGQYFWRVRAQVVAQGQRAETVGPTLPLWVGGAR